MSRTTGDEPSLGGAHPTDGQRIEPALGGEAALTHLIDLLHSEEPDIRLRAVEQLEAIGSDQAVDLLEQAANDPNNSVRERAIRALGRIPDERAVDILLDKLQTESQSHVRIQVIEALGETGSERAVDPLIMKFQSNAEQAERHYAALALGQIGAPQAAAVLAQGCYDMFPVRRAVGRAIRQIGEKHADVVQPVIDQLLDDLLSTPDTKQRFQLIDVLSHIRPASAVPRLIDAMEDPQQQLVAIQTLRVLDDKRASAPLLKLFASTKNDTLRSQTARALVDIRDDEAISVLIDLLKHEDWKVRWLTPMILSRRDVRSAVPHLIPLLEDSRAEVRKEAADALGRLCQADQISQAIEPLTRALEDQEASVRRAALLALDRIRLLDIKRTWGLVQDVEEGQT